jgi:dimethylamine/trimethylamine dehydrogenase
MVEAIRSGQLDIVGGARPSIADPFLPQKIEEGRLDEIRQCIGCNMCVGRVNAGGKLVCTQNATSGEEYRRGWHPERFDRAVNAENDVLVVGGGPAGMECAIVLAKRGLRRVHLVEAGAELGGHWRWVPRFTGLGEWARVVAWRRVQLDKLASVEVVTGEQLDAAAAREYGAELVVVATGSHWATDGRGPHSTDGIPGADASRPDQATPEQIMDGGKTLPGETAVVYDSEGYFMGVSLAERLAEQGKKVRYVTGLPSPGVWQAYTGEVYGMLPRLVGLGVELVTSHRISEIEPGGVRAVGINGAVEWEADSVVLVTQRLSDDSLYRELAGDREALEREGVSGVYRIGDCFAPRLHVADAIFDGHRLAREIDTEDPAVPLPYVREHRILGSRDEDYDAVVRRPALR